VERNSVNLARGFVERGHPVQLVLSRAEGPFLTEVDSRVDLVDLKAPRIMFSIQRLGAFLRKARPAVLLSGMAHANFAAILARQLAGFPCRLVVSVHTCFAVGGGYTEKWLDRNTARIGRVLYPRADRIIAVSQAVADNLAESSRLDPSTITVIPNPVVMPESQGAADVVSDHPFLTGYDPPFLVAVGRLSPEKGFDVLIKAHSLLLAHRRIGLLILGEGTERPRLETLVKKLGSDDFVDLPGFVESPLAYISHATALVMPSRNEGFGNALVEAMACGVPVVATDCSGGPTEILDGGRFGPLAAPDDPAALARAIEQVLQGPVVPSVLKERAREFAVDRVVGRYLEVLFPGEVFP
jgi:glycosyltransferase involved in cell wall biosynthesis